MTGGTSGIGKEVARNLARMGGNVVLTCRDPAKGDATSSEITASTGAQVTVACSDLSSLASVRTLGRDLAARYPRIDVLVNNAAIYTPRRQESRDGIELTWATNVLSYHALTQLLLPSLKTASPSRIVNVASTFAQSPNLEDLEYRRRRYSGTGAYRQSKAANRMLTWAIARRLEGSGVTANAVHPGGVATGIYREVPGALGTCFRAALALFAKQPVAGADTPTWTAAAPELERVSAHFFVGRRERRCEFRDPVHEEQLWAICDAFIAR
ncbi:MAG TPA: SDR family NAD(P)-dependent oxidoreductase [Anaeromyxobacteraceae bacterium]|nr:SDR family NAD(P)-dependent oxidoreductase [Anaeromyxobacteraceae bacterium]